MGRLGKAPKKLYSSPVLTVYGTVRDLTRTVSAFAKRDGGTMRGHRHTGA